MTTPTPRMTIKQVFLRPEVNVILSPSLSMTAPAKSIWSAICNHCSTSYETHSHGQALNKARWHLTVMQPCQPLPKPLTIHTCLEPADDEAHLPAL